MQSWKLHWDAGHKATGCGKNVTQVTLVRTKRARNKRGNGTATAQQGILPFFGFLLELSNAKYRSREGGRGDKKKKGRGTVLELVLQARGKGGVLITDRENEFESEDECECPPTSMRPRLCKVFARLPPPAVGAWKETDPGGQAAKTRPSDERGKRSMRG